MVRTQLFLRADQIEFLDELARRTGKGCSRSDWARFAIDQLRQDDLAARDSDE